MNADDYIVRAGESINKSDLDSAIVDLTAAIKLSPNMKRDEWDKFVNALMHESEMFLHDSKQPLRDLIEIPVHRNKKVELFYTDLLKLVRKLAKIDSEKYLPKVVRVLILLATFQHKIDHYKEAEDNFSEVLKIQRKLADQINTEHNGEVLEQCITKLNTPHTYLTSQRRCIGWVCYRGKQNGIRKPKSVMTKHWEFTGSLRRPIPTNICHR